MFLFGDLALPLTYFLPQLGASLVLLFPVIGAVFVPVLAEFRREGFGEKQKLDVVSSRCNVFLHKAGFVLTIVRVMLPSLLGRMLLHIMIACRRWEEGRVREEKREIGQQLFPPWAPNNHDFRVDTA